MLPIIPFQHNETTVHYHLQWNPPENADKTDIDFYELIVVDSSLSNNGTETWTHRIITHANQTDVIIQVSLNNVYLNISATDKCHQSSDYAQVMLYDIMNPNASDALSDIHTFFIVIIVILFIIFGTLLVSCSVILYCVRPRTSKKEQAPPGPTCSPLLEVSQPDKASSTRAPHDEAHHPLCIESTLCSTPGKSDISALAGATLSSTTEGSHTSEQAGTSLNSTTGLSPGGAPDDKNLLPGASPGDDEATHSQNLVAYKVPTNGMSVSIYSTLRQTASLISSFGSIDTIPIII